MSAEMIYSLVGIVIFIIIIIMTLRSDTPKEIQTKEEKQYEIIGEYKKQLREALKPLNDEQDKTAKKRELLMKFNKELSLNIFFDEMDIKETISELSQEF
ncbi:MAG: hypothetical protein DRG78_17720 [Epsilonproteobacteria bacterium]|nr:MAG: hypothetical protein DRG78_17720 [Campylobacterota bacterium]